MTRRLSTAVRSGVNRWASAVTDFTITRPMIIGRALVGLAQLSILGLTSWANLTPQILGQAQSPICSSVGRVSIFCLDPSPNKLIARVALMVILGLVVAGVVPAVTSFLHLWASFSIASSVALPDGGDQVAVIATFLIAFITLGDIRLCAWTSSPPKRGPAVLAGVGGAAIFILRLQIAFIYLQSGLSKLGVEDWLNGSALYYVVRDPSFGATGPIGEVLRAMTAVPLGTALLTWGTISLETAAGVLVLSRPRRRQGALVLVVALHVGILLAIGLWSFAIIMIGAVTVATAATSTAGSPRPSETGTDISQKLDRERIAGS